MINNLKTPYNTYGKFTIRKYYFMNSKATVPHKPVDSDKNLTQSNMTCFRHYSGPSRRLLGDHTIRKYKSQPNVIWSQAERDTLAQEMVISNYSIHE